MCVCVFWRSLCSKVLDWKTILRDYCVDWIIGWVVCWIAFISVFFSSWKTILKSWLDTSSTPCCLLSFLIFYLLQSRQLLNSWWIDRESSCLLDSFLTPGGSFEIFLTFLLICPLTDPRQLHLSKYIMLDTCLAISLLIEIPLHAFHFSLFCIFSFVSIVSCFFFFL